MHEEARRKTKDWEMLPTQFCQDLSFEGISDSVTQALRTIKAFFFF
jgi:hypothetical protein